MSGTKGIKQQQSHAGALITAPFTCYASIQLPFYLGNGSVEKEIHKKFTGTSSTPFGVELVPVVEGTPNCPSVTVLGDTARGDSVTYMQKLNGN